MPARRPIRPLPRRTGDEPDPVGVPELLDQVLSGLGAPSVADIVAVHERWPDIVGDELVGHAAPVAIEDRTLRVEVDGPAWASHLRWAEADILRRIDGLLGEGVVTAVTARIARR